jgi:hypothetical protein
MILVQRNDNNEIAFTAVENKLSYSGIYKLVFKNSITKYEKYVIPTIVTENARYILLDFTESYFDDQNNGIVSLRGGYYPAGEYTYQLWESDVAYQNINLLEQGEMKLLTENVSPEIQYNFFQGNNPNTSAYVFVTPASPTPGNQVWNTTIFEWQLNTAEWQNA